MEEYNFTTFAQFHAQFHAKITVSHKKNGQNAANYVENGLSPNTTRFYRFAALRTLIQDGVGMEEYNFTFSALFHALFHAKITIFDKKTVFRKSRYGIHSFRLFILKVPQALSECRRHCGRHTEPPKAALCGAVVPKAL